MARQQDLISSYIRTRRATDRETNPLNAIFNTVAQAVIDHRAEGFKNLETLKSNRESITSGIDQRITKISPLLNPVINEALTGFKEQYDKGAKMNSLALTPKKRQEGKDMMKIAMDKMMALSSDLDVLKLQRERARNMSNIMNGESGDGTTKGMNPGASSEEFRNTTMLGNDELLKSMTIDKDSGRLMVVNRIQNPGDPSEGGYAKDLRDYGAPGGLITTDPSDDPKSGASPGNLRYYTPEEIKEMQKNNTLPEDLQYANAQDYQQNVLLKDMKFAQEEDPGMEATQKGFVKQAIQRGEAGKSFDPQYYQSEIWGAVKDAPDNAFKTYFFGGNTYDFSSGKMPESSPAYNYLRQTMPNIEPGSKEWEVAMEQLKFQNFGRNSDFRKIVAANMFDVAKAKYDDYKAIYDQDQEKKNQEANMRRGVGKSGGYIVGKQSISQEYWDNNYKPFIDKIENPKENSLFTSPAGFNYYYKNGQFYTQGETDAYDVKVEPWQIASYDMINNYVDIAPPDTGENKEENLNNVLDGDEKSKGFNELESFNPFFMFKKKKKEK